MAVTAPRVRLYTIGGVVFLSCLTAYLFGFVSRKPAPQAEPAEVLIDGLAVAPAALDFGEVWEQKAFAWEVVLENRTDADVRVPSFVTTCGCVALSPRSVTVPARGTAKLAVTLDLTHRGPGEETAAVRPFTVGITPVGIGQGPRQASWVVHGTVKSRVTLNPLYVHFSEMAVQGQAPPRRKVVVTAHVPVDALEAFVNPAIATVEVKRSKDDRSRFELTVAPLPTLPPGPFSCTGTIALQEAGCGRCPAAIFPVEGQMMPEVRPFPAKLLLGSGPIGSTVEGAVVLQAPAEGSVVVESIQIDSPDVHVRPVAVEGMPEGRTYRVTQRVSEAGDHSSVVRFVIRKADGPPQNASMEVWYRGEAPSNSAAAREGKEKR
jgi:hypothetical protein